MNIQDFGACAEDGSDTTPAVRAALESIQGQDNTRLSFPPGRYDFYPNLAFEKYLFVSNHDESLKRIVFLLDGFQGLEIDGQGSQFVFHGLVSPFAISNCRDLKLFNFTIDWVRTFHSETIVLASCLEDDGQTTVDLAIPEAYPYKIAHKQLIFTGEGKDTYILGNALEFDVSRRETSFQVWDNYELRSRHLAEEIGPGQIRLTAQLSGLPTVGNMLALIDGYRYCPAISASDSSQIEVKDVSIYHCGGMGFIAQRCRDIRLEGLQVIPSPGTDRIISISADATHFVNCAGHIELENCRFENQLDDATNVHGIYTQISKRISDTELEVRLVHEQQQGVVFAEAGDRCGFIDNETLATYHTAQIESVERFNKTVTKLKFSTPLPPEVTPSHGLENLEWIPDVTIRNCESRGNRARSFLLSTAGRVLVENNIIHSPGASILIAGDANYWFESGAVRDVTIRDNLFDNCLYGVWGRAIIDICPEIEPAHRGGPRYHRNITVENNRFKIFDNRLVRAQCVDGLIIRGNQIEFSTDYPRQLPVEPFEIDECSNVTIEDNTFALEAELAVA